MTEEKKEVIKNQSEKEVSKKVEDAKKNDESNSLNEKILPTKKTEEKKPERKKLSLQGNKKLSLGSGQDFIKSNRSNSVPGTRSVQIETRRKRIINGLISEITLKSIATNQSLYL